MNQGAILCVLVASTRWPSRLRNEPTEGTDLTKCGRSLAVALTLTLVPLTWPIAHAQTPQAPALAGPKASGGARVSERPMVVPAPAPSPIMRHRHRMPMAHRHHTTHHRMAQRARVPGNIANELNQQELERVQTSMQPMPSAAYPGPPTGGHGGHGVDRNAPRVVQ